MPKTTLDESLTSDVRTFVEDAGSVSAAALRLGVERTMLWRFHSTGRAIERNRLLLRNALDGLENATKPENATEHATQSIKVGLRTIASDDLTKLRTFFQNMIALVDAYEMSRSN
jgi:hypothetical protein